MRKAFPVRMILKSLAKFSGEVADQKNNSRTKKKKGRGRKGEIIEETRGKKTEALKCCEW